MTLEDLALHQKRTLENLEMRINSQSPAGNIRCASLSAFCSARSPKAASVTLGGSDNEIRGRKVAIQRFSAERLRMLLAGMALSIANAHATSIVPPAPILEDSLKGSTVILVATGIELYFAKHGLDNVAATNTPSETDGQHSGSIYLRAKVNQILRCIEPCTKADEIYIAIPLPGRYRVEESKALVGQPRIYLLRDRLLGSRGLPSQIVGNWYATATSTTFFSFPEAAKEDIERKLRSIWP